MLTLRVVAIFLVVAVFGTTSALQHVVARPEPAQSVAIGPTSPERHLDHKQDRHVQHSASAACLTLCVGASPVSILSPLSAVQNYRLLNLARAGQPDFAMIGASPPDRPPQRV